MVYSDTDQILQIFYLFEINLNVSLLIAPTGTKLDLKQPNMNCVSVKQAKKMKSRIKAFKFLECSAQSRENLEEVFIQAVKAVLAKSKKPFINCTVM